MNFGCIQILSNNIFLIIFQQFLMKIFKQTEKKKDKFFFFWPHWVFVAAHGLSLVAASGVYSSLRCMCSHCGGFSHCGAQALGVPASVVVACGL